MSVGELWDCPSKPEDKNVALQPMSYNFTCPFTTLWWESDCCLPHSCLPGSPYSWLRSISESSHCTGPPRVLHRLWPHTKCHHLLTESRNQNQQIAHWGKLQFWLISRAKMSEGLHIPAGHTEIWYPKSQPKQIHTAMESTNSTTSERYLCMALI